MRRNMAAEAEVDAPPSTPTTASMAPSSDAPAIDQSSPASSPPAFPWEQSKTIPTRQSYHAPERNVFSVLGKRKLTPLSGNIVTTPAKKTKRSDDGKTQMQLQLGQKIQRRCKDCGMQYVSSSEEDRQLHAKFHKQHVEGVEVGIMFVENAPTSFGRRVCDGVEGRAGDKIVFVDCFDKKPRRRKGQEVLEIVQRDLGAVEIAEADVWDAPREDGRVPKFRSFMYVREGKCVGFLLAENISEAFEVLPPTLSPHEAAMHNPLQEKSTTKKQTSALAALQARKMAAETARVRKEALLQAAAKRPLVLSQTKSPAVLGICRIWTLPSHRGQGIAVALLDAAVKFYNDRVGLQQQELGASKQRKEVGCVDNRDLVPKVAAAEKTLCLIQQIGKKDVAFSQPTAAGTGLARRWTGKMSGWKVYVD